MANYITSSSSTPRGLAFVAYGDPERYAQVKNQIRTEIDLGSSKLLSYNKDLLKDSIAIELKSVFEEKYSFISENDIKSFSSNLYTKIITEIDSNSSYNDSIYSELSDFLVEKFPFISKIEATKIISNLFSRLRGKNSTNVPNEIISFPNTLDSETFNDLTKIDSLPSNSVIGLVDSLLPKDVQLNGQSIQSYLDDTLSTINNLGGIVSDAINGLIGYPSDAISSPTDANGEGAKNLSESSQTQNQKQSNLFGPSLLNLNLVQALKYDPNNDPFNPEKSQTFNVTSTLNSTQVDTLSEPGAAFR